MYRKFCSTNRFKLITFFCFVSHECSIYLCLVYNQKYHLLMNDLYETKVTENKKENTNDYLPVIGIFRYAV